MSQASPKPTYTRAPRPKPPKLRFSRRLRRNMTAAEVRAWAVLRQRKRIGMRWRRQAVIYGFIADFYCPAHGLILEIDGSVHDTPQAQAADAERTRILESYGFRVIRLTNAQTFDEETILTAISAAPPASVP